MPLVAGTSGGQATGLAFDAECRIWAACGTMGGTAVYDESGNCLAMYHFDGNVHGVAATSKNVFFTDADQGKVYCVGLGAHGSLPGPDGVMTLALPGGLGEAGACNKGVVAAWNGCLIIVQAAAFRLYAFDPVTRTAKRIDIGRASVADADGLLLRGSTLYVVRTKKNKVSKFRLSPDLSHATLVDRITDADLDCPSTITAFGGHLYAVNARFSTPPTPSTSARLNFSNSSLAGWWIVMMIVLPVAFVRSCSKVISAVVSSAARPEVGSSRNKMTGSVTSSRAMLTRLRWPPESTFFSGLPIWRFFTPSKPRSLIVCSTRWSISSSE